MMKGWRYCADSFERYCRSCSNIANCQHQDILPIKEWLSFGLSQVKESPNRPLQSITYLAYLQAWMLQKFYPGHSSSKSYLYFYCRTITHYFLLPTGFFSCLRVKN